MPDRRRIVIVGGGIWGLSAAFHLAMRPGCDVDVLVVERNPRTAAETTPRASGLVGQIRSLPVMNRAIRYALDLFARFPAEHGHDPGLHRTGSLMLALTPERMQSYERHRTRAAENGVEAAFVSHQEVRRLAPHLQTDRVEGALFIPGDGYLDPERCAAAYENAARDAGARILLDTPVTGLRIDDGCATGVETADGFVPADAVIVTAGPWTGMLARLAGCELAMTPIRHQRALTAPLPGIPDHFPVVRLTDLSIYLRAERGGYLFGPFEPEPASIDLEDEPSSFRTDDIPPPVETIGEARRQLGPFFPIIRRAEIVEYAQGMTTFAPDGRYLLGPVPGVSGLFVASGCAALGIAGSAAVGRWLANWALEGDPGEDLSDFALARFGERAADRDWVRESAERYYATYYAIRD
ncbi:MAG: FAD-dependent oxidoreductase [Planctomycetaceae bacterium]